MPSKVQLVGGGFQDSEGNVLENGYLEFFLSQDTSISSVGNICSGIAVSVQLDSSGNVASSSSTPTAPNQYIWGNDVMSTPNTFYKVLGYTASGQPAWGPNNQQVVGSGTFDLGTWIPNTIYSWTPPVQPLTLEVNGVAASSQILQNLVQGSNVTITDEGSGDIEISASGGATFSGSGAFFFGPGLYDLATVLANTTWAQINPALVNGSGTANQVTVYRFMLDFAITISEATTECLTNTGGGATGTFGIYDDSGNLLVNAGTWLTLTSPGIVTNTFTPVTLQPGVYYHAQAATVTSSGFPGLSVNSGSITEIDQIPVYVKNATRLGTAANPLSSGSLPATLGTITPFTPMGGGDDGICCPIYE
jgi:hypothetical protein